MNMTIQTLTDQEIFDTVARHLLTQNQKSLRVDEDGKIYNICLYRGSNGLKCAAGCLIPDNLYNPEMDSTESDDTSWSFIVRKWPALAAIGNEKLIAELQDIHDLFPEDDWKDALCNLAENKGLSSTVMNEFPE